MSSPTSEEIDRLLDSAVAVTDAEGRLLGSRDLTPAEKRAPAVTVVMVGDPDPPRHWLRKSARAISEDRRAHGNIDLQRP